MLSVFFFKTCIFLQVCCTDEQVTPSGGKSILLYVKNPRFLNTNIFMGIFGPAESVTDGHSDKFVVVPSF